MYSGLLQIYTVSLHNPGQQALFARVQELLCLRVEELVDFHKVFLVRSRLEPLGEVATQNLQNSLVSLGSLKLLQENLRRVADLVHRHVRQDSRHDSDVISSELFPDFLSDTTTTALCRRSVSNRLDSQLANVDLILSQRVDLLGMIVNLSAGVVVDIRLNETENVVSLLTFLRQSLNNSNESRDRNVYLEAVPLGSESGSPCGK
jgi:hypothetical protein